MYDLHLYLPPGKWFENKFKSTLHENPVNFFRLYVLCEDCFSPINVM